MLHDFRAAVQYFVRCNVAVIYIIVGGGRGGDPGSNLGRHNSESEIITERKKKVTLNTFH
jgi:hypothetical protein